MPCINTSHPHAYTHAFVLLNRPDQDEGSICAGDFQIYIDQESTQHYGHVRNLTLTNLVSETSRAVKQFQFTEWPGAQDEPSGYHMLSMCADIKAYQESKIVLPEENIYGNAAAINEQAIAAQIKSIVIHCSAGVGRTGSFCAIHIGLKKLELESRVDIFTSIKHMRTQRMSMIQTPDQYEFVYKVLLESVGRKYTSNIYQNVTGECMLSVVCNMHGAIVSAYKHRFALPIEKRWCA